MKLTTIGYFIKYLDQANVNNAFVSGMYTAMNRNFKRQED